MISTFTSNDSSKPLVSYLMMSDEERSKASVPLEELRTEMVSKGANNFLTFKYQETPDILHESQMDLLCDLLDFMWGEMKGKTDVVDMRMTLTPEQLVAVSIL